MKLYIRGSGGFIIFSVKRLLKKNNQLNFKKKRSSNVKLSNRIFLDL